MAEMRWRWARFDELSRDDLYAVLHVRQVVFVVEQHCFYLDADGLDQYADHLLGYLTGELVAYLRVMHPGKKHDVPAIGRVLTAQCVRGQGYGKQLMAEAMARMAETYPGSAIRLSAQVHLQRFYEGFGFEAISEPYDDAGVPHIDMIRRVKP